MSLRNTDAQSPKSAVMALILCLVLGIFGAHRFYVGKVKTGIIMLITLGGLGIWALIDLVMIACNEFTDQDGRTLVLSHSSDSHSKIALGIFALFCGFFLYTLCLLMLISSFIVDGASQTVYSQLRAIRHGEMQKAYDYGSNAFHDATSYDVFKQFVDSYGAMKDNQGIKITSRAVEDAENNDTDQITQTWVIDGVVYSADDSMQVKYRLVYEDHAYKILNIKISPSGEEDATDESEDTDAASITDTVSKNSLTYDNTTGKYSILYPDNWYYENTNKYSTIFSGKKGTAAYISTVTIQTIPMEKAGGIYNSAKAIVDDLKTQIEKEADNVKFGREGEAELPTNPKKYQGLYFEVSYKYKDIPMRKMQFIIVTPDKRTAYSWGYTTTEERYVKDLPIAQAMYESWVLR